MSGKINLYDVLKNSYADKNKQMNSLKKEGYKYDSMLSNHNQQVYYNPNEKKLILNVAGTHNLRDWATDAYLAAGKLKDTNRFKEAKNIYNQAKQKYQGSNATITGHSLGGSIAGYISGDANDKVVTFNKGATIGQKMRANETHYRTRGDLVSVLNTNSKHTQNINNPNKFLKNPYSAHMITTLNKSNIKV
jgi:hypothetical protein